MAIQLPALALRFPDEEAGSRSLARGVAVGTQLGQGIRQGQTDRTLAQFAQPALAGDQNALAQIAQASPQAAQSIQTTAANQASLSEEQRQRRALVLGQGLTQLNALPEEQRPEKFQVLRQMAIGMGTPPERIPEQFDQGFVDSSLAAFQAAGVLERPRLLSPDEEKQRMRLAVAGKPETTINLGSEAQNKAATFASRMGAANETITRFEGAGADPIALVGNALPNVLKPDDLQALDTTARDFTGAILRKESGAAIPEPEIQEAFRVYIPQPGDSEQTLAIKRANRTRAIENMKREAGPVKSVADIPGIVDPKQESRPLKASALPEGTVASDGTQTLIVKDGKWEPFDGQ